MKEGSLLEPDMSSFVKAESNVFFLLFHMQEQSWEQALHFFFLLKPPLKYSSLVK